VTDDSRIEELRRRVRRDPASLAFAPLAEELRRARRLMEAVTVCRAGLELYPGYLSARVTLGRCFIDLNRLDDAEKEIEKVREVAPENVIATRAHAEIRDRRSASSAQTAGGRPPSAPGASSSVSTGGAVEGPDATYDGATFKVRQKPDARYGVPEVTYDRAIADFAYDRSKPDDTAEGVRPAVQLRPVPGARPSTPHPATWEQASPVRAVEEPDATYGKQTVRTQAALEAWLDAIHATRASRSA
jgi:tetratricopeptide (TPR) repeat protein